MSQRNVEAVERFVDAFNRRDVEAMLEELDPEVEWHSAILAPLVGKASVYRGHDGVRELLRDMYDVFAEYHSEYSEIRDLGDRIVGIGRIRTRGRDSGAEDPSRLSAP